MRSIQKSPASEVLSLRAYEAIRGKIARNELLPGQPIQETALGAELGMSRTPIREALKALEKENLVKIHSRVGVFITPVSLEKIREIYQIREIIEGEVGQRVTPHMPIKELSRIKKKLLALRDDFLEKGKTDVHEARMAGRKLHDLIYRTLGNKTLSDFYESLSFDSQRGCSFANQSMDNAISFLNQHLEIIRAFEERDGKRVKELLQGHLKKMRECILD